MKNSVKTNYIYNIMYQFLAVAVPILTTPYVSRVLGASGIGIYNYVGGIVSYFGIFAITGTSTFGVREIARNQSNLKMRSKIFWEIFIFRLICTITIAFVYIVFTFLVLKQYRVLLFINIIMFFSWSLDVSWYFQGIGDFKVISIRNSFVKVLATILIFCLVRLKTDLNMYMMIYVVSALVGNITLIPYLRKEIIFYKITFKNLISNFNEIMSLFIPVIAIQLYTVLNKIMLGMFSNVSEVGYFSQANQVVNMLVTILSAYSGVLIPKISFFYSRKMNNDIKIYVSKAFKNLILLGLPMTIGFISISNIFVPIFFGDDFGAVVDVLRILSLLFLILGMGQMLGSFLVAINRQRSYTIAVCCAAVSNLILNSLFLYLKLGAEGVAIATVISEIIATSIQLYFFKEFIVFKWLNSTFFKCFISAIVMFSSLIAINCLTGENLLIKLLLMIFGGTLSYFIALYFLREEDFMSILNFKKEKNKK